MAENAHCPNCDQPAEKNGNEITCAACDATFKIKKTGGAVVKESGTLAKMEQRIANLEAHHAQSEPEPEPDPDADPEPEPDPDAEPDKAGGGFFDDEEE